MYFTDCVFPSRSILCQSNSSYKTLKVSSSSCEPWLPGFHLNWNNAPLQFLIRALLYEHKRHGSEQDGHDEQVIVVKHVCKCQTIAFRATVCLWICTVIVSSQLGYLHNQLSGLAILRFPFPPSLQLALCPIYHLVYAQLLYICIYLCCIVQQDWLWLGADSANYFFLYFFSIHCSWRSQVGVHCFFFQLSFSNEICF